MLTRSTTLLPDRVARGRWTHPTWLQHNNLPAGRARGRHRATAIDHQSDTGAERGTCIDPHGHDAGTRITARKRHGFVAAADLMLRAVTHADGNQGCDGDALAVAARVARTPFLAKRCVERGDRGTSWQPVTRGCPAAANVAIVRCRNHLMGYTIDRFGCCRCTAGAPG